MAKKLTQEEVIARFRKVHGERYDYSKVVYVNARTKVCIICKEHGEFWQTPEAHLKGQGCCICGQKYREKRHKWTFELFIESSNIVHGNKYDYSFVRYINNNKKVDILCPKHGIFSMKPKEHICGQGCPICGREKKKHLLFGVGINDCDEAICSEKVYSVWRSMIERCYSEKFHKKRSTYIGCSVCDEFKYLSKFKEWFDENYVEGWHLDKDILVKGNKIYSPETCCFVPPIINTVFTKTSSKRGALPIGVKLIKKSGYKKKYTAQIEINNKKICLGYFYTIEEAFKSYKCAKEKWIKELANTWKEKISLNVYEELINYQVEITD